MRGRPRKFPLYPPAQNSEQLSLTTPLKTQLEQVTTVNTKIVISKDCKIVGQILIREAINYLYVALLQALNTSPICSLNVALLQALDTSPICSLNLKIGTTYEVIYTKVSGCQVRTIFTPEINTKELVLN